jgi:hypothetical protein
MIALRKERLATVAALVVGLWFGAGVVSDARGVTLIQQSNGTVKTYSNVYIVLRGQVLTLRSADNASVLRIMTGACSFAKNVQRCLPYSAFLTHGGKTRAIAISYGTVYLNLASEPNALPSSSEMLAPRTVLVLLKTARGTYVTVKGSIDEVKS